MDDIDIDIGELDDVGSIDDTDDSSLDTSDIESAQNEIEQLGKMSDEDILESFKDDVGPIDGDLFDSLTDGLQKEALEHLRDGLVNGDEDVYDYFGLRDVSASDSSDAYVLSKKL